MAITGTTDLGDGILAVTVDHDPETTPTDVPAGSLIITAAGIWHRKLDAGSTTNVTGTAALKNSFSETTDPGVNDDSTQDYDIGSRWINTATDKHFVCLDATATAAVWKETTPATAMAHDLGGSSHNADTLANLNSKISDATLDDSSAARPPTAHGHAHSEITGVGTDDHHPKLHAADHIGATDEIDGDKLDIDFNPSKYTPDASIAEADDVDDLSAHLKGIDTRLGEGGDTLHEPCRVATTANITLSGLQTIDSVAVAANDRVLVQNQTALAENGIYGAATGAWARTLDADTADELDSAAVFVTEGNTHANQGFWQKGAIPILDTDPVTFVRFTGLELATAGAGLVKSGAPLDTLDVGANGDGSVVVNADDIQVGVLATDAQHGSRGGGTQHPAATGAVDGFMAAADKTKLDGVEAGADITDATNVNAAGAVVHGDISEAEGILRKTGAETYVAIKTNLAATTDPGATDDSAAGYAVGSRWTNVTLDKEFVCLDATATAAVWKETTAAHGPPLAHAASHIDGSDDIQDATAAQKGLATAAQITKLDGVETAADVTDAVNVNAAGAVVHGDISEAEGILRKTGAETYEAIKSNLGATTDPGATDDSAAGYAVGSRWINVTLDKEFVCLDATAAAAVWTETTAQDAAHALGGAQHTADTLANLNTKISDGTLIDTGDSRLSDARTPTSHGGGHVEGGADAVPNATGTTGGLESAADKTKLDAIEASADVTDAANVDAAGAVVHGDVTEAEGLLRKTGAETYEAIKTNLAATTDPGATDDSAAGYAVGSRWINVTLDKEFVCLDSTATAAVWTETTASGGGGVFGQNSEYSEKTTQQSTSSQTYQQYLRHTTASLPAGTYRIGWMYVWRHSTTSADIKVRLQVDDTTHLINPGDAGDEHHLQEPQDSGSNQRFVNSGFRHLVLGAGVRNIDIDFGVSQSEDGTAYIFHGQIEIWRVA